MSAKDDFYTHLYELGSLVLGVIKFAIYLALFFGFIWVISHS